MSKFRFPCIKCQEPYNSDDPEPYYCKKCEEVKNKIAAEIDKKLGPSTAKVHPLSPLQVFEANAKVLKDPVSGRTITFGRA